MPTIGLAPWDLTQFKATCAWEAEYFLAILAINVLNSIVFGSILSNNFYRKNVLGLGDLFGGIVSIPSPNGL